MYGVRLAWSDLPDRLHDWVGGVLGAPVVSASSQPAGFSPGSADRVVTADGRRGFVKAVSPEQNPDTPGLHRRETAVLRTLADVRSVPRLIDAYDDGEWEQRVHEAAWFLAVESDQPVGVVAARQEEDSPENERELQAMWVTPASRKSGIAQALGEAVIEWAREDGADAVTLYVGPGNEGALAVYESLGFSDTGDRWRIREDDPKSDWIKMARAL